MQLGLYISRTAVRVGLIILMAIVITAYNTNRTPKCRVIFDQHLAGIQASKTGKKASKNVGTTWYNYNKPEMGI